MGRRKCPGDQGEPSEVGNPTGEEVMVADGRLTIPGALGDLEEKDT